MKVSVEGTVVAEADEDAVVSIEGSRYFPPSTIAEGSLKASATPYTCPWKGAAQYYDVVVNGTVVRDGAWSYPEPKGSAIELVGKDFSGYVAFDLRQVDLTP
ncbi:DUF427 domain-containing protein [Amycolatopsis sp. CA-161197]|uniref:DUF427 domain-containing protein n=1 Tax=Amycolatopsis sp. CA-161197 TaxID=3239922 RepID=UPI003D923944